MQKLLAITIIVLLAFATISHHINVAIPEECCRKESAISLLQQLRLNITELPKDAFGNARLADNRKNALQNKINALISQVKAGAYEGSLNKLSNDLKKTVSKWIINPWKDRLLDLIEQVIHCIKACCYPSPDVLPPVIRGVLHYPNRPNYDDRVVVLACVVDCKSGVDNVTLSYSTSLGENVNLTMTKTDSFYMVEIPQNPTTQMLAILFMRGTKLETWLFRPHILTLLETFTLR